jgi:hypothetical protein
MLINAVTNVSKRVLIRQQNQSSYCQRVARIEDSAVFEDKTPRLAATRHSTRVTGTAYLVTSSHPSQPLQELQLAYQQQNAISREATHALGHEAE